MMDVHKGRSMRYKRYGVTTKERGLVHGARHAVKLFKG